MDKEILFPIDTANFKKIREKGFVYVDKTPYIHTLIKSKGTYFFLSRPRRFGKSLFLDTLAEYFKGNRSLFKGLAIDDLQPEEWESFPVLRLDLSAQIYQSEETLVRHLAETVRKHEEELGLPVSGEAVTIPDRFYNLIRNLSLSVGKGVVILIDEYDSPLSTSIDHPKLQEHFRQQLHGFYSVLKKAEKYIHFSMLTGVTRYGKVSIFSGLNNLNDISFDDEYAGICGITEEELHRNFREGVRLLAIKFGTTEDEIYRKLKFNYDGYHFSRELLDVYNPYSINHALSKGKFEDYWCRSGVPTILSKSLMHNDFDVERLNGKKVAESDLADLSTHSVNPISLFYQTGYLTIKAYEERRNRYTLGYPNREVETAILSDILKVYMHSTDNRHGMIYDMEDALEMGKPEQFIRLLSSFLGEVPGQLHRYVDRYENYYHTIFYCLVSLIGLDVKAEYATSEGFIDIVLKTSKYIYVIELKVNGTAEDAIRQIESRHYCIPFVPDSRKTIKIGIGFSKDTGNISSFLIH